MRDEQPSVDVAFPCPNLGPAGKGIGHFVDAHAFDRYAAAYRVAAKALPSGDAWTLETSRGQVRGYRFGPEPEAGSAPLLLLSGRNAGTPSWAPALPALLELGLPVYALDSPGEAGCSSQTAALGTAVEQAAWVADSVEALGLDRVHLVGHSLGGWLATHVARHRPEVLASVTVLDPPAAFAPVGVGFSAAGLAAVGLPMPEGTRRRLLRWIAGGSTVARPAPHAAVLEDLGLAGLQTFRVRQPPPKRPAEEDLHVSAVPSLAVIAGQTRVHAAGAAAGTARDCGWRVEVWEDAGHTLHADFPERLAALLRQHLGRRSD